MKTCSRRGVILLFGPVMQMLAAGGEVLLEHSATVVDERNRPVEGATVDYYHLSSPNAYSFYRDDLAAEKESVRHTVTDRNGTLTVSTAQGTTVAVVKKPGLATTWRTWSMVARDRSEPLVMTAPSVLAGKVVDEKNQPVAGAKVFAFDVLRDSDEDTKGSVRVPLAGEPASEGFAATTGGDGSFRIADFPSEAFGSLGVARPGKMQGAPVNISSSWPRNFRSGKKDIVLVLGPIGPVGNVEGKVTSIETGQPVAGVLLKLERNERGNHNTPSHEPFVSDSRGEFRIPGLPPGS